MKTPFLRISCVRMACAALAAAALAGSLAACVPLVVGGGAVVGSMMAADRRTTGTQVEDEGIELRAANRLREALGDSVHVNVTSYNRQVLLTGEVPSAAAAQQVEQIVQGVDNVISVVNDLGVMAHSSLSQRTSDAYISTKVRASLVDAKDLSANWFKVLTERNVVYLMGIVTPREAKRSAEIARGVDGVRKVVRVFEVISEDELSRRAAAAQAAQAAPASQTQQAPAANP